MFLKDLELKVHFAIEQWFSSFMNRWTTKAKIGIVVDYNVAIRELVSAFSGSPSLVVHLPSALQRTIREWTVDTSVAVDSLFCSFCGGLLEIT